MKAYLKKHIYLPHEHGSWVFILSPLAVGMFAGKHFSLDTFFLVLAAMSVFMLRQPVTVLVKVYAGRRPRSDLRAVWFWVSVYAGIAALALTGLVLSGYGFLVILAVPGLPIFGWHLWLVRKRAERRQAGVEILATAVLALAAPAAFWVGQNHYDPNGWWLWGFTWLQSAASITYAYLRLAQREIKPGQTAGMTRSDWQCLGLPAFLFTSFNLMFALLVGLLNFVPLFIFLPFSVQWSETVWGIRNPAVGWKPTKIGIRQLIVSILWTGLFILLWR